MYRLLIAAVIALSVVACSTSPLGRTQFKLFPSDQVDEMGALAFNDLKKQTPESRDPAVQRYVQCVARSVLTVVDNQANERWEVVVFASDDANAFALPGRKIGVYTGMLKVARTDDQLAAVIGHEIAHVIAEHSNERLSTSYATESGLQLIQAVAGSDDPGRQRILGLLGVGAQVGVLLPFGRAQESEADLIGLDYMARAGFNPQESVALWQNMSAAGGGGPPEFLSTHPSHETRIGDLRARMPQAMALYRQSSSNGKRPNCGRP